MYQKDNKFDLKSIEIFKPPNIGQTNFVVILIYEVFM